MDDIKHVCPRLSFTMPIIQISLIKFGFCYLEGGKRTSGLFSENTVSVSKLGAHPGTYCDVMVHPGCPLGHRLERRPAAKMVIIVSAAQWCLTGAHVTVVR